MYTLSTVCWYINILKLLRQIITEQLKNVNSRKIDIRHRFFIPQTYQK